MRKVTWRKTSFPVIPIEVSARHIHLTQKHIDELFGKEHKLTKLKSVSQSGQFAANETVNIIHGKNKINNVRIIGPPRDYSQVEISITDAIELEIKPVIRLSGDIKSTPGIKLQGPKATIHLTHGVIIAKRHLHVSDEQANKLKLKNHQNISIKVKGERGLIFNNVIVRKGPEHNLSFQIDTDEANAMGINNNSECKIVD